MIVNLLVNLSRCVKGATSLFAHLETFNLSFSSSSFVIRVNLLHPQPSLFLYGLLLPFWCFSFLVTAIARFLFSTSRFIGYVDKMSQDTMTEFL